MTTAASHLFYAYTGMRRFLFNGGDAWLDTTITKLRRSLQHPKLYRQMQIISDLAVSSETPFTILITGEAGSGKSSLINALAGGTAVRVGSSGDMPCIHRYLWGDESAVVRYTNGNTLQVTHDEATQICVAEALHYRSAPDYRSAVCQIDWHYSLFPLLENCVLAEVPSSSSGAPTPQSLELYVHHGDAVIWLIDATSPKIKQTFRLLNSTARYARKCVGVITRWDAIEGQNRQDRLYDHIMRILSPHLTIIPTPLRTINLAVPPVQNNSDPSAVDLLKEILLTRFLTSPLISRNISRYHAARLAAQEALCVMDTECSAMAKNLAVFRDASRLIEQCQRELTAKLLRELSERLQNDLFGHVNELLGLATEKSLETILGVATNRDVYEEKVASIREKLTETRDRTLAELRNQLEALVYHELSYGFAGTVLSVTAQHCCPDFPQPIEMAAVSVGMSFGITFQDFVDEIDQSDQLQEGRVSGLLGTLAKRLGRLRSKESGIGPQLDFNELVSAQVAKQRFMLAEAMESVIVSNMQDSFDAIWSRLHAVMKQTFISEDWLEQQIAELRTEREAAASGMPRFAQGVLKVLKKIEKAEGFR